jgi:AcrR family transcriptional regulator
MATRTKRPAPAQTRAERGEQTRTRLLEATITSIARDGISGASIERITDRAGVSRGLVRHYFGTKRTLLAAAFQLLADDYCGMLGMGDENAPPEMTAEERLCAAVVPPFERLKGGRDHQYAWFGFWALARSDQEIQRINHDVYDRIVHHLGGLVAAVCAERGREVDAAAAGRGLAAMIEGAWLHCLIGVEGVSVAEAERLSFDYITRLLELDAPDGPRAER